jgi:hypothetical protein
MFYTEFNQIKTKLGTDKPWEENYKAYTNEVYSKGMN